MSVGLLAVLLLYRFYVRIHLSKWLTFSLFKLVVFLLSCRSLRLLITVEYETFGISKRFPIKLHLLLMRAARLYKPLTVKCIIHNVEFSCFF